MNRHLLHLARQRTASMLLGAILAAIIVAAWPALHSGSEEQPRGGYVTLVRRGDLSIEVPATGALVASRTIDILPPSVEGLYQFKIARLVDEGIEVKPGDLLVEFDGQEINRRLQEQVAERAKAEEELNKRKLEYDILLRDLRIRVEEVRVNLEKARHKAEVDATLMSEQDYRQAQIQLDMAKDEDLCVKQKLQATERMMEAELLVIKNNLDKSLKRVSELQEQRKVLRIAAPAAGVVIFNTNWNGEKKQVGDSAWRMETIMKIPDLSTLHLEAMVEEADAGGVSLGQRTRIMMDAFPEMELQGQVRFVGTVLRTKRWDTPLKVVDAIIEFEHPGERLLPGMTGTALIEVARIPDVLLVPVKAIREKEGHTIVLVVMPNGNTEERAVEVGRRNAESYVILEGLKEGEKILS